MKLKAARKLLKMTQNDVADWFNYSSNSKISKIESGETEFIPVEYHEFLLTHGIDLNSLYDRTTTEIKFINKPDLSTVSEPTALYNKKDSKDKQILKLIEIIDKQQETIDRLTAENKSTAKFG